MLGIEKTKVGGEQFISSIEEKYNIPQRLTEEERVEQYAKMEVWILQSYEEVKRRRKHHQKPLESVALKEIQNLTDENLNDSGHEGEKRASGSPGNAPPTVRSHGPRGKSIRSGKSVLSMIDEYEDVDENGRRRSRWNDNQSTDQWLNDEAVQTDITQI